VVSHATGTATCNYVRFERTHPGAYRLSAQTRLYSRPQPPRRDRRVDRCSLRAKVASLGCSDPLLRNDRNWGTDENSLARGLHSRKGASDNMSIADKAVLVTGANRGIGQALVEEALRRGARRVYAGAHQPLAHPDGRVTPMSSAPMA